jgi:hypothetical protein
LGEKIQEKFFCKKNYPMKRTLYIIKIAIKIALSSKIPSYLYSDPPPTECPQKKTGIQTCPTKKKWSSVEILLQI